MFIVAPPKNTFTFSTDTDGGLAKTLRTSMTDTSYVTSGLILRPTYSLRLVVLLSLGDE